MTQLDFNTLDFNQQSISDVGRFVGLKNEINFEKK